MRLIDADALMKCIPPEELCSRIAVTNAPTIEERKTGKWIPDNNNYYEERYVCSACKHSFRVDVCMGEPMWQFCPNCGAKMEVENG